MINYIYSNIWDIAVCHFNTFEVPGPVVWRQVRVSLLEKACYRRSCSRERVVEESEQSLIRRWVVGTFVLKWWFGGTRVDSSIQCKRVVACDCAKRFLNDCESIVSEFLHISRSKLRHPGSTSQTQLISRLDTIALCRMACRRPVQGSLLGTTGLHNYGGWP